MRTAIVADTNSGITPEEAAERGITLIPMPFLIDGAEYLEGEDCTQPFFFERLAAGAEVATSQPSPGGITERWDRLLEDHGRLVCTRADLTRVDPAYVLAVRQGEYSTEALIRDKDAFRRKYPRLTVDPVTLDEIMVFLERGTRS